VRVHGKGERGLRLTSCGGWLGRWARMQQSSPSSEVVAGRLLSLSVGGKETSLWVVMLLLLLLVTETGLTFSVSSMWLVFSMVSLKSSQEGTGSQHHQREYYGRPEGFPSFRSSGAKGTVCWTAA
jgi:hypothetical protein